MLLVPNELPTTIVDTEGRGAVGFGLGELGNVLFKIKRIGVFSWFDIVRLTESMNCAENAKKANIPLLKLCLLFMHGLSRMLVLYLA